MRLPLLPPASLSPDQQSLYDDMVDVIEENFGELVARRSDGALIGPFNAWLHFPQFGKPAWAFNRAMWEHSVLLAAIHQLVILVTAAKFGARYEIYGHEYFAGRAGLADQKIASIVAGERPDDLTHQERVAYDMAATLKRAGRFRKRPSALSSAPSETRPSPKSSFSSAASRWSVSRSTRSMRRCPDARRVSTRSRSARAEKIASTHYLC